MQHMTLQQYIKTRFKMIEDNMKPIVDVDLLDEDIVIDDNEKNDDVIDTKNKKVNTYDTITDPNHRYITDLQLAKLESAINESGLAAALIDLENNFKMLLNQQLDNILSDNNISNSINNIRNIISTDKDTLDLFKNLVSTDEFNNHIKNKLHISNDDREALNQLLKFIKIGCADWNAEPTDPNYIRNKPEALPANGGDSNTVGGYCAKKLINKQSEGLIIGTELCRNYSKDKVDIYISTDNTAIKDINPYIKPNTSITIREGDYYFDQLILQNGNLISGVGDGTIINSCLGVIIKDRCKLKDIVFKDSVVNINCKEASITGVTFEDCTINININKSIIKNCIFKNCTLRFTNTFNSIIKDNICESTSNINYLGGNNIIKDNIIL